MREPATQCHSVPPTAMNDSQPNTQYTCTDPFPAGAYAMELSAFNQARAAANQPLARSALGQQSESIELVVEDGVAVATLHGPILNYESWLQAFIGGSSHSSICALADVLARRQDVSSVLWLVDSPGGTVAGVAQSRAALARLNALKPTGVLFNGMGCSSAVWTYLPAETVAAADDTTLTGSIGILIRHVSVARAQAMQGIDTEEIFAGRYKPVGSPHSTMKPEHRDVVQGQADYLYGVFLGDVAKARKTTPEDVHARMADGRVFVGKQAVAAGLVDQIATREQMMAELRDRAAARRRTTVLMPGSAPTGAPPQAPRSQATQTAEHYGSVAAARRMAAVADQIRATAAAQGKAVTIPQSIELARVQLGIAPAGASPSV